MLYTINELSVIIRLLLAFTCGLLLGLSPEYKRKPAGMRTHILVCLGAATASMTGFFAYTTLDLNIDPLRIAAQVISGIGFLGVGTIMITGRSQVQGLTTAAGLWVSAAVGISIGSGFYLGGILCTVLSLIAITVLQKVEKVAIGKGRHIDIYLEIINPNHVNQLVRTLKDPIYCISNTQIKPARSGISNHLGIEASLIVDSKVNVQDILDKIAALDEVAFAIESE